MRVTVTAHAQSKIVNIWVSQFIFDIALLLFDLFHVLFWNDDFFALGFTRFIPATLLFYFQIRIIIIQMFTQIYFKKQFASRFFLQKMGFKYIHNWQFFNLIFIFFLIL